MGETLIQAGKDNIDSDVTSTHDIGQDLNNAFKNVDAAIDFTAHHFTKEVIDAALESKPRLLSAQLVTVMKKNAISQKHQKPYPLYLLQTFPSVSTHSSGLPVKQLKC